MLCHSNSPLINFCHFLINSVMKPLSPKMTEINQGFFPIFSSFSTSKKSKNLIKFVDFGKVENDKNNSSPCGLAEMTEINQG